MNWRTTLAGVCGLLVVLATLGQHVLAGGLGAITSADFATVSVAVTTFIGLLHAKDKQA